MKPYLTAAANPLAAFADAATRALNQKQEADIAVEAARMVNDGIAEFVAQRPDRLKGFGTVPMLDSGEAAKELERCATELGFKGVQTPQRQRQGAV